MLHAVLRVATAETTDSMRAAAAAAAAAVGDPVAQAALSAPQSGEKQLATRVLEYVFRLPPRTRSEALSLLFKYIKATRPRLHKHLTLISKRFLDALNTFLWDAQVFWISLVL